MNEKLNKTTICSIVFLDIIDYSKKSVSEQIDIKNQFNQLINHSLKDVDQDDRIILDTGDGAAIAHLGSPEDALFVSLSIRDEILKNNILSSMPLYVRFGINLGPVRLVSDINGQPNIIGDGINVAQRIMSFAKPNQIVVSRSYYDVTSRLTQEISQMFDYSGIKHDKHVREHEIYAVRLMKDQPAAEVKSTSLFNFKLSHYLQPIQHFIQRLNWKYAALSLPAIFTCVLVIKSAASSNEPVITMPEAVAATTMQQKPAQQTAQLPTSDKAARAEPSPIQLANYVVEPNATAASEIKAEASTAINDKGLNKDAAVEQSSKTLTDDKKVEKKVAKKSDKKAKAKKETSDLPPDFVLPTNHNTQPVKTVAVVEPQVAAAKTEQSGEKSSWKTFTDSVKQGQQRACSQVEITMNQCH